MKPGQGTPLFVCHGDFCGWGFYAFRLAELLKGDGPVYLLHSLLDSTREIETIEDMVRRYLPDMQAAAPNGPIRLAGYCHGGLAALELARRLEGAGRTVEKIVLIDTFSHQCATAHARHRAGRVVCQPLRTRRVGPPASPQRITVAVAARHPCPGARSRDRATRGADDPDRKDGVYRYVPPDDLLPRHVEIRAPQRFTRR